MLVDNYVHHPPPSDGYRLRTSSSPNALPLRCYPCLALCCLLRTSRRVRHRGSPAGVADPYLWQFLYRRHVLRVSECGTLYIYYTKSRLVCAYTRSVPELRQCRSPFKTEQCTGRSRNREVSLGGVLVEYTVYKSARFRSERS